MKINKSKGRSSVWLLLLLLLTAMFLINGCAGIAQRPSTPAANLLDEAELALQSGNYSRAELNGERALRIEPRNGRIWHLMARIRFEQGDFGQTVQFCFKSNTLAGRDRTLMKQNWLLLEKAYTSLGETTKAEEARLKAAGR